MANSYEYIFFEADQVLTNNDLNETFSYLDQQSRWTRNKLIGIGIVCGFDIVHHTGVIEITKGCGVTSQGYLITQEDALFTYYMPYNVPLQPANPLFDYPDNNLPFYQPFYNDKEIYVLLTDDQQAGLEADQQQKALLLSQANFLENYVVVYFLEATETDLKNCDMFDCNNNGERVSFNLRPLLIAKKYLPGIVTTVTNISTSTDSPNQLYLKRFNVPFADLQTSKDVLNAFAKLADDSTLKNIADAYNGTYENYKAILDETGNPFIGLFQQLQKQRDTILKSNILFIQYFYDFIDDLIKAYCEFTVKVNDVISACCPNENLFPLHLVLGDASLDTSKYTSDSFRQYFIFSPLFNKVRGESSEAVFLFERMKLLIQNFTILSQKTFDQTLIKVTPSQYEHEWLSQRAIPYYYKVNDDGGALYKTWDYYKTSHGRAASNLSYRADEYSSADNIINPLLYDMEYYNFLRVEGHLGKNYTDVLNNLVSQIQSYNLPFDVVAIQAGGDDTSVTEKEPQCSFQDLNTLFNVLRNDVYCQLGKLMCFAAGQVYAPPIIVTNFPPIFGTVVGASAASTANISDVESKITSAANPTSAFSAAAKENIRNLSFVNSNILINFLVYQKSTFLKNQSCFGSLADNSVGKYYVGHVPAGTFFFSSFDAANLSLNFLTIVDLIEEVIGTLYYKTLSNINLDDFTTKLSTLQNYLLQLNNVFLQFESTQKKENYFVDYEEKLNLFNDIIDSCFVEKFSTLSTEYNARVKLLKQQLLFPNYYKKHQGMEHKAGVPKGGTFIMVYNAPAAKQSPNRPTVAGNNNLSAIVKSSANIASSANNASISKIASSATLSENELKVRLQSSFSDVMAMDPGFLNRAISILSPSLSRVKLSPSIADNVVIADFYLPYLCCSDCAPVNYILPPKEDIIFDIQPNTFLFDDAHNYPFNTNASVTPEDFDSTANPGKLNLLLENNKLNLHPAMEIKSTLVTKLTYKDITIPITIVVPDASFTINVKNDATGQPQIFLAAKNTDATTYQWFVNDKENIFDGKAEPAPVALSDLQRATDSNQFKIEFVITYVINENTSSDDKTASLTSDLIVKHADKGPFDSDHVE